MRIESGALINANVKLRNQLDTAKKALRFYADQKHFDTVAIEGSQTRLTRILDNGAVAEEALDILEKP